MDSYTTSIAFDNFIRIITSVTQTDTTYQNIFNHVIVDLKNGGKSEDKQ